jgi:hypothetical protein
MSSATKTESNLKSYLKACRELGISKSKAMLKWNLKQKLSYNR